MLAATDRGSHVEQEKLIALDEEEQSRWENDIVSSSPSEIEDNGKDEPAEPDSQESLQQLAGQTIVSTTTMVKPFLPNSSENFLTNLVARAAEFRSCKEYFSPGATFETAL